MKFSTTNRLSRLRKKIVSVPLRGYGFEMGTKLIDRELSWVSVPLRGYGFEIGAIRRNGGDYLVSVPLRGYGFEI